jgi:tetratricopeptide (TPR) repeat protein
MSQALYIILTVTLLSPVLWVPLLTRAEILKCAALLIALAVWRWRQGDRRSNHQSRITNHGTLALLFASALIWTDGTLLWLSSPESAWWQGLPVVLLGVLGLWGLVPRRGESQTGLPPGARALLWVGLGVAVLIEIGGDARLMPWGLLAALPLLLLPWSLPTVCGRVRGREREMVLSNVLLVSVGLLTFGGLLQEIPFAWRFAALAHDPTPWNRDWTETEAERIAWDISRFPPAGGQSLLLAFRGLMAQRRGQQDEALRDLASALSARNPPPAVINAVCHAWGRLGALGQLASTITPAQVIESDSIEAARPYVAALIVADDFARARVVHKHFGDALFVPDHPVLTPARIGAALVAWGRPEEAIGWFSKYRPQPEAVAESLFWRGMALQALGRPDEARSVWQIATVIAPHHADAAAHAQGKLTEARVAPDLLPVPIAGRQLTKITLTPVSPEAFAQPLVLQPGQILRVDCLWRLTHVSSEAMNVSVRLADHEAPLMDLGPTAALVAGDNPLHLGECVETSATLRLPETLPSSVERAELVVSTGPSDPLPQRAVLDLAPLASAPGFGRYDPRNTRQGISSANRLRLFPRGSQTLGVGVTLQGAESATLNLDQPVSARRLAVISYLSGARGVPDNAVVAELFLSDQGGGLWVFPIMAGRDTADIWHEYPPTAAQMRHRAAPIAWQEPRDYGGFSFHNSYYVQTYDLGRVGDVRTIRLRSFLPDRTSLRVLDLVAIPEENQTP